MLNYGLATALVGVFTASAAHAQALDQQERCAMEAKRSFQEIEAKDPAEGKAVGVSQIESNYQSHYNTKMAGTVEGVRLDELHGLRISIRGHDGKRPVSTIKFRADRMKTAESESQQKPDTTFETQLSFAQPALSMDAYLAQVRAGDGSRVKFRPRLATISTLRCACMRRGWCHSSSRSRRTASLAGFFDLGYVFDAHIWRDYCKFGIETGANNG